MDVDSDASVTEGIGRIVKEGGPVDVLVNNAGIERTGSVEETPLAEFRAVMETNYFGAIRCIQAVLPAMRGRRSGCIVNVASVAGRIANSPMAAYTASKFALEALSEALAQEAKPFNVRVAIVEPGIIDTAMARRVESAHTPSPYPQERRFAAMFSAASGDCRAGDHRHGDGQARRVGAHSLTLSTGTPLRRDVFRGPEEPGTAICGGREGARDRGERHLAAAASGGTRRDAVSPMAQSDERRGVGRLGRAGRRCLV